jgi:hypothetical protein
VSLEEADFIHDMNNKLSLVNDSSSSTRLHSVIEGDKVAKTYIGPTLPSLPPADLPLSLTDLWVQLLSPMDSSSALVAQGKSVLKVFQQLKINPSYRDPVRDLFTQLGASVLKRRKTAIGKSRASVRSVTPKASRGSTK